VKTEKSAKSETSNFGLRFLRFFEMALQKNVKGDSLKSEPQESEN